MPFLGSRNFLSPVHSVTSPIDPAASPLQEPQVPSSPYPSSGPSPQGTPRKLSPVSCSPVPTLVSVPETRQPSVSNEKWGRGATWGNQPCQGFLKAVGVPTGQSHGLQVGAEGDGMERSCTERTEEVGVRLGGGDFQKQMSEESTSYPLPILQMGKLRLGEEG